MNTFSSVRKHIIIAVGITIALVALASVISRPQRDVSELPICPDCNVVIVAYDALQAAHVSHLGYPRETTPMLDALAREGVSFGNAVSSAPWTVPSYMSIFTGLYPSEHKVVNKFSVFTKEEQVFSHLKKLSPDAQTLAEVMKANGYATGGFTGDAGVHSQFGYNQGFDAFTDEVPFGSMENSANHAFEWLEKNKENKFFMFFHGYDSHGQFKVPEGYKGKFMSADYNGIYKGTTDEQRVLREKGLAEGSIDLSDEDVAFWRGWYDSKIRDADDRFARFWDSFSRMQFKNKTIVVILSDHGTEFYEHKRFDHGFSLYDELVHVPLVFVVPGLESGKVVREQVSTIDVAPTLFDVLGIDPGEKFRAQMRGTSLFSYLKNGKGVSRDVFMETDYRDYTHKRGIRTANGWKFIWTMETGEQELYNIEQDPQETNNVVESFPDIAAALAERVRGHNEEMGQQVEGPWKTGCVPVYGDQCK
ncbi:MAG: sulfatase [Patescibacteria group bacterium]